LFMMVKLHPPQINECDIPVQAKTRQTGYYQGLLFLWATKVVMILQGCLTHDWVKLVAVFLVSTLLSLEVLIASSSEYI
jgi:putative effector of murein hydrolase LrgA (UPF0299 family)